MVIGKYVINSSKKIKNRILNRKSINHDDLIRMIQIYNSRIFGLCFYRTEIEYQKDHKKLTNKKQ